MVPSRNVPFAVSLAVVALAVLPLAGCGGNEPPKAEPTSTVAESPSTSTAPRTTTAPPAGAATPGGGAGDPCSLLAAGLSSALPNAEQRPATPTGSGCKGATGVGGIELTLASDVDSSAFESALADPDAGDPASVGGLGEMAAITDIGSARRLVTYADGQLVSLDATGYSQDQLVAIARAVLAGL